MTTDLSTRPVVLEGEFTTTDVEVFPPVGPWAPLVLLYGPVFVVAALIVFALTTR